MALITIILPLALFSTSSCVAKTATHIVYIGDSNLWIGGDNCSRRQAWSYWFNAMIPGASGRSYARSGATWTNTENTVADTDFDTDVLHDNNVIYNEVLRLTTDYSTGKLNYEPDIIFLSAGTNDAWFNTKRPGIFSVSPSDALERVETNLLKSPAEYTSLAEAVICAVTTLRNTFPAAAIVLVTPPETTATSVEMISKVAEIISECATLTNTPCVRLDTDSGISSDDERQRHKFTTDGTHTSPKGAEKIAHTVYDYLSQFNQDNL